MIHLPKVDVSRLRISNIEVKLRLENGEIYHDIDATIKDVETGHADHVYSMGVMRVYNGDDPVAVDGQIKLAIKHQLLRFLAHELDECLYFDGTRLCAEPHPERKFLITKIITTDDAGQPPRT